MQIKNKLINDIAFVKTGKYNCATKTSVVGLDFYINVGLDVYHNVWEKEIGYKSVLS